MVPTDDDGYVVAGVTWSGASDDGTDADDGLVGQVDDSGSQTWSTTVDTGNGDIFETVSAGTDRNLYAAGHTDYAAGSDLPNGLVVELDSGGSEADSTTYGGDGYNNLSDIGSTDDDASLLAGERIRSDGSDADGWIIKTADPVAGVPEG